MANYKITKQRRKSHKVLTPRVYSPLDPRRHEIRLLVLKRGSYDKPLIATLKVFRFPQRRKPKGTANYETISYVWGNPILCDTIIVNDESLKITANAASALRCMRLRHGERTLWIDSVCINQQDLQERAQQVAMMADIYSCAQSNLIHLGDDGEKVQAAFDSIERIFREVEVATGGVRLEDHIFDDNGRVKKAASPLTCDPDLDALSWLYRRPWFSHLWVVQEQLLSSHSVAYCGSMSIAMTRILTATVWLAYKLLHLPRSISSDGFSGAVNLYMMQDEEHNLANLLLRLGRLHSSDVRDKVFGGFGLYQSENHQMVKGPHGTPDALVPDYTKEPVEVLRDATKLCIEDTGSLYLLARGEYGHRERLRGLPTWVPDWYCVRDPGRPKSYLPLRLFDACHNLEWTGILPHLNPNILSLRGVVVSSISWLAPITTMEMLEDARALRHQLQHVREKAASVQVSESALAMTLIVGTSWNSSPSDEDSALQAWQAFLDYMQQKQELPPVSDNHNIDNLTETEPATQFQSALRRASLRQRVFTTVAGQVGIGSATLKKSDLVVILPRSAVPFALRKKEENVVMIGQIYVHGIMHGEVFENDLKPPLQWTTLNIE